jgi:predicted NAD/FAD-dependent oxidoreductase
VKRIQTAGIIGAGISGLACAQQLRAAGIKVTIFEKSRGLGGRMATRRFDSGAAFDHGAQYFTARDPRFANLVQEWCAAGAASLWTGRIVSIDHGTITEFTEQRERYVGVPAMSAIAKALATGLEVRTNITVQAITSGERVWQLTDNTGQQHGPFDALLSTAPPIQSRALLGTHSAALDQALSRVVMEPCWTVMLQAKEPLAASFDGAFVRNSPLSWIARNSSKPNRTASDCWVLQASGPWSRDHLEEAADAIAATLTAEFWQVLQRMPQPLEFVTAHRWRYAAPQEPLPERCLWVPELSLGACGDWCGGPRVEGAYLSGIALAEAVLAQ